MLRGMVFLDYLNFDISLNNYYTKNELIKPKLDYFNLFPNLVKLREGVTYTKSYIFAPKPDDFLLQDERSQKYFAWLSGLQNAKYIDVVFGRQVARPTNRNNGMDITDRSSYYVVEKGTDLNLGLYALSGAFHNSYDIAYIISGDTDYISLYTQLKMLGKIVIVCVVKGQSLGNLISKVDDYYVLDEHFFNDCLL